MTKAETLQKYLPCHATYGDFDLCVDCPYNPNPDKIWEYGCARGQDKMIDDAIALLKEQEAVKPIKTWELNNLSMAIDIYLCGNCKEKIVGIGKYCSYCGKPVLWEGR